MEQLSQQSLHKQNTITVIGINPDSVLDPVRIDALTTAEVIYTSPRHQKLIHVQQPNIHGTWQLWQSPIETSLQAIKQDYVDGKKIVIIASGDPMCHGIGTTISTQFTDLKLLVMPAPSSFSLATAKLQWPSADCIHISLHRGPETQILNYLNAQKPIVTLTKNQHSPKHIAEILVKNGWGDSQMTVLEELSGTKERVRSFSAQELAEQQTEFQNLNVISIIPTRPKDTAYTPQYFMQDSALKHDGQLTKFAFRAITLATLNPAPNRVLWDIGAGSGSISLGWIKLGGQAIAIEKNLQRSENIRHNAEKHLLHNIHIVTGDICTLCHDLHQDYPAPDAIFVGGALHVIKQIMPFLRTNGVLVANAITIQSQQEISDFRLKHGGNLRRINIEEEEHIAHIPALKPTRSILQYWWQKS